MPPDHWYVEVRDDELNQGDLISNCTIMFPEFIAIRPHQSDSPDKKSKDAAGRTPYRIVGETCDIVVMTQSCDLANKKSAFVLVCPHYSVADLYYKIVKDSPGGTKSSKELLGTLRSKAENIRAGKTVGRYMLPACRLERWNRGIRIVDFERASSLPYEYLMEISGRQEERLRIKSPYREHLSQAFATYFMRVALDAVISTDELKTEITDLVERSG